MQTLDEGMKRNPRDDPGRSRSMSDLIGLDELSTIISNTINELSGLRPEPDVIGEIVYNAWIKGVNYIEFCAMKESHGVCAVFHMVWISDLDHIIQRIIAYTIILPRDLEVSDDVLKALSLASKIEYNGFRVKLYYTDKDIVRSVVKIVFKNMEFNKLGYTFYEEPPITMDELISEYEKEGLE